MLLAVARAHLEAGQAGDAFLYLRSAENSASHRGEVRRLMGLAHLETGDVAQAVDELMAAVRDFPDDAELKRALDEALEGAGTTVARDASAERPPQISIEPPPPQRVEQPPPQRLDQPLPREVGESWPQTVIHPPPESADPPPPPAVDQPRLQAADHAPTGSANRPPRAAAPLSRAGKLASRPGSSRPRRVSGPHLSVGRPTSRLTVLIAALFVTGAIALSLRLPSSSTVDEPGVSGEATAGKDKASPGAPSGLTEMGSSGKSPRSRAGARVAGEESGGGSASGHGASAMERSADRPLRSEIAPATMRAGEAAPAGDAVDEPAVALVPSREIRASRSGSALQAGGPLPAPAAPKPAITAPQPPISRATGLSSVTDGERPVRSAPDAPPAAAVGPAATSRTAAGGEPPMEPAPTPPSSARGFSPEARDSEAGGAKAAAPDLASRARDGEMRPADPALNALRGRPRLARMDSQPALRKPLRIRYTDELARQGARGRAVFWVLVSAAGEVADVRLLQSSGSSELDTAAADAIWRSPFAPARRGGKPFPAWTQQQIVGLCCRSAPAR